MECFKDAIETSAFDQKSSYHGSTIGGTLPEKKYLA